MRRPSGRKVGSRARSLKTLRDGEAGLGHTVAIGRGLSGWPLARCRFDTERIIRLAALTLDYEPVSVAYADTMAKRRVSHRLLANSVIRRAFTGVRFATMEAHKAVERAHSPGNITSTPPIFGGGGSIAARAMQSHPFISGMQFPGGNTATVGAVRPRAPEVERLGHVKENIQAVRHRSMHSFGDDAREINMEHLVRSPFGRTSQAEFGKRKLKRAVTKHHHDVGTDTHTQREHGFKQAAVLFLSKRRIAHNTRMAVGTRNVGKPSASNATRLEEHGILYAQTNINDLPHQVLKSFERGFDRESGHGRVGIDLALEITCPSTEFKQGK